MKIIASKDKDELFLHIQLVVLNDKVNLNGVVVTKDFIRQIVEHKERYEHTPLFCDIEALKSGDELTHRFNNETGKFETEQIGSFTSFYMLDVDGVTYLIGDAKVSKRNEFVVNALKELDKKNNLCFSYEIEIAESFDIDGVEYVTGDPNNHLIGVAVVTHPAVEESKALLVASANEPDEKEEKPLDKEKEMKPEEEMVEEKPVEEEEETAEDTVKKPVEEEPSKEQMIQLSEENETLKEENNSLKEEIAALKEKCAALTEENESKDKESKKQALIDKVKDVLTEEEMNALEEAFDNLDEAKINETLAEKLIREKTVNPAKTKTASRMVDAVEIEKNRYSKWITL